MKKPSKCASVRGMEGVLSLVVKTFLKNDPTAVLRVCKTGTVDAKIRQFSNLPKSEAIFFVSVPASDDLKPSIPEYAALVPEEAHWEDYFIQESAKAQELKARINATDQEIDRMVYQLYELTEEEIGMVEKG